LARCLLETGQRKFMDNIEAKLQSLGLELPNPPSPGGDYVPFKKVGNLLYCSGVISTFNGEMTHQGQVGADQTVETGMKAAEVCALNVLAVIKLAAGSLDAVKQIVFVGGYVNAVAGFDKSPQVINGASGLFAKVLGEVGRHSRAAVAVAGLPVNATVEIQATVELHES